MKTRLAVCCALMMFASCSTAPLRDATAPVVGPESAYSAGMRQMPWSDASRPSWKNRAAARPVRTTIWYPADRAIAERTIEIGPPGSPILLPGRSAVDAPVGGGERKWPLILLSHGTGGSAVQMMWLGSELARHGFIAVAVDHHGNTAAEGEYLPQGFVLWWERARDLSFVLDTLLHDPQWSSHIDAARIGAAGFSLGGYTVALLAGARVDLESFRRACSEAQGDICNGPPEMPDARQRFAAVSDNPDVKESLARAEQSWRDARIRAAFLVAPAVGNALKVSSLDQIDIPVAIVVGQGDAIAPAPANAQVIANGVPAAHLEVLPGVAHYTFLSVCGPAGAAAMRDLCTDPPGVDRKAVHAKVASEAARFFERALLRH